MTMEILITALAKGAVGKFAAYPLNTILGYLIDQVTAQEEKLSSFEQKLDQHITNPFRVGQVYLEEARNAPNQARQREHLNRALEAFISVSQVQLPGYPLLPIKAQFYVGVCYDLLSDEKNALRWYNKSFQAADKIYQAHRGMRSGLQSFTNEWGELTGSKTGGEKVLYGALDKVFGGIDWLTDNLLKRKAARDQERMWANFVAIGREVTDFRRYVSELLAARNRNLNRPLLFE